MKQFLLSLFAVIFTATIAFADDATSYKVSYSAVGAGTVTGKQMSKDNGWTWEAFDSGTSLAIDTWLQIRPIANAGAKLVSLTQNGEDVTAKMTSSGYYNTQVADADLTFVATFESDETVPTHTVTYSVSGPGKAEFSTYYAATPLELTEQADSLIGTAQVAEGEYIVAKLTPDDECGITSLIVGEQQMFENVNHDNIPWVFTSPQITADTKIVVMFDTNANIVSISAVTAASSDEKIYDLQGRRISTLRQGVNIVGGKKILK